MKTVLTIVAISFSLGSGALILGAFKPQENEPWTQEQLLDPQALAKTINNSQEHQPLVLCVGPVATIKNSIEIGATRDKENLDKLKQQLKSLPKDEAIVLYCGCCPFGKCPNIRPAFSLLNQMQFKNHKLLNLPHNLKVDWIDHGYPVNN